MTDRFAAALGGARFAILAVLALLLAGCVISSKAELVADAEAVDVLPTHFFAFGYSEDGEARKRSEDAPQPFVRDGHTYVSADKSTALRLVPIGGAADTYLLAAVGEDGSVYGIARYRGDGVLSMDLLLTDDDPSERIAAEIAAGTPGLDTVTADQGGITIADRAALDQLVRMHMEGRLPMETLVAYITETPDDATPARIVPDGDFWKPAD